MPWVRVGDTAATHPVVLAAATVPGADSRTVNELLGWITRSATLSAAHLTDYIVELGTLTLTGGPDTDRLIMQACAAGYLTPVQIDGRQAWRIKDDDPDLIHMRTRAEVLWDRQRSRDVSSTDLTLAVLRRDGSACRYCGRSVHWADRKGTRGGTYDHLTPGKPAGTPAGMVVACKGCNSARGRAHAAGKLAEWDRANPLRPAPKQPLYCEHAIKRLAEHGIKVADTAAEAVRPWPDNAADDAVRPSPVLDTAAEAVRPGRDTAAEAVRPATEGHGTVKPGSDLPDKYRESRFPGSGRAGSGRQPDTAPRRRRKPRSRLPRAPGQPST